VPFPLKVLSLTDLVLGADVRHCTASDTLNDDIGFGLGIPFQNLFPPIYLLYNQSPTFLIKFTLLVFI
jgi:hypothetical protein